MTQAEVAAGLFSVSYISAVERGQIKPSLGALEVLANQLEVQVEDLVGAAPLPEAGASREQIVDRRAEDAEGRLRQAQALAYQRDFTASINTLRQINPSYLAPQAAFEVRLLLIENYIQLGRGDDAQREALEGITQIEHAGGDDSRARMRNLLGAAYQVTHKHQLALEQFRQALDILDRQNTPDPILRLNVLYNLGSIYWLLGQYEDSIGYLRQSVELAERVSHPERLGDVLWTLSSSYQSQGDLPRAKIYALRSLAAYEQASNQRLTAHAYTRLGRALAQADQPQEALTYLGRAQSLAVQHDDPRGLAEAQRSLAAVYIWQGRLDEGAEAARDALNQAEQVGDPILRAEAQLTMATLHEARGAFDEARHAFEDAIAMLNDQQAPQHLADAYASFSEFLDRRDDKQQAFDLLKQAWRLREGAM